MRKLITSFVTDTVAMPMKAGSIDHLQLAHQELFDAIGKHLIGTNYDATKVYIMYGCVNTGSGSTYTISAGCVFYAGEFYLVDAVTFTTGGGQTAVATIGTTYNVTNADPVLFTNGVAHNVHPIRKVVIAAANTGTGIVDYSNFIRIKSGWTDASSLSSTVLNSPTGTIDSYHLRYLNNGNFVVLGFNIQVTITSAGFLDARIILPFPTVSGQKFFSTVAYAAGGSAKLAACQINPLGDPTLMFITTYDSMDAGTYYLNGQITYEK